MNEIKKHLKKYQSLYVGTGCLVVCVGVGILYMNTKTVNSDITQKALAMFNSTINQTAVQVVIDAPGNSGNVVKDLTTGAIYPSQNAAAKALGIGKDVMSKHIAGKIPDAGGHVLEKLIDGGASHNLKLAA